MIGTKFYKDNYDLDDYSQAAEWCNTNNATIEDKGEYYEVVEIPPPSLEEAKNQRIKSRSRCERAGTRPLCSAQI